MRKFIDRVKKIVLSFFKEQVLPRLIIAKDWLLKALTFLWRLINLLLKLATLLAVIILPFLHNCIDHRLAKWIFYPACGLYFFFFMMGLRKEKAPLYKDWRIELIANWGVVGWLAVAVCVFIANYYNCIYGVCWAIFVIILITVPAFFFTVYYVDWKTVERTEEERKNGAINIFKRTLQYWLYDFFFLAAFNEWETLTYCLGIVVIVVIFYNVTKVFLKGIQNGNTKLHFMLPFDFLFGVGLCIYLINLIENSTLRETVLTMTSAILGGLLALVGVAWTIQSGEVARQSDLLRMEAERKEDERKKHIPYVRISFDKELPPMVVDASILSGLDMRKSEDLSQLQDNTFFSVRIRDFNIKNVSSNNIILLGVIVHGKYHRFTRTEIMEPGACCKIITTGNCSIPLACVEPAILLVVSDVLGNQYEIECPVSYKFDSNILGIETTINGETYTGFDYTYVISSAGLPVLQADESDS